MLVASSNIFVPVDTDCWNWEGRASCTQLHVQQLRLCNVPQGPRVSTGYMQALKWKRNGWNSKLTFPSFPFLFSHHHEIQIETEHGTHSTGDDYGYTELSPENPFKGPAQTMTHSYSPPSVHFGGGSSGHPQSPYGHAVEEQPPPRRPISAPWSPFKAIKNKFRGGGPQPPSPPPHPSQSGGLYGPAPPQPDSQYGQVPFAQGGQGSHFPGKHYGIKPEFISHYSTLPKGTKGAPPSPNSIYSYYPMKTPPFRPSASPLPPTTASTYELSTPAYHQPPVRTPAPPPLRGYGPFSKGPPFSFSFQKPQLPHRPNGHKTYQKLTLNYKGNVWDENFSSSKANLWPLSHLQGYMPPPPAPSKNKRPYGYTPTSYDGTGLATAGKF